MQAERAAGAEVLRLVEPCWCMAAVSVIEYACVRVQWVPASVLACYSDCRTSTMGKEGWEGVQLLRQATEPIRLCC